MISIPGRSVSIRTGPVTSFDVPIRPPGSKARPSVGQRSPSDRAATGAIGNSENRLPTGRSSPIAGGDRNTTSCRPSKRHRRSANRIIPCSTAS